MQYPDGRVVCNICYKDIIVDVREIEYLLRLTAGSVKGAPADVVSPVHRETGGREILITGQ